MNTAQPTRSRVVIIGGGIVGTSVAYHLTKLGLTDVVLLEQGSLSGGTTWHAAGLIGQLRATSAMTELIKYSTELYATLEEETGYGTGWKQSGSMSVARTPERMASLRRTAATAQAFGVEAHVITPAEAAEKWPLMRVDDIVGAVWLPGDGKANPTDLTQAFARGARSRGAKVLEKTKVIGIDVVDGRITGVRTEAGTIECEIVVNCAGQWAAQVGAMAGTTVPLHSVEHFYVVTDQIEGVTPDLPVLRDQDGYVYFKEEVGSLVVGGFEPDAKPWVGPYDIPDPFVFQLLDEDWEQFSILMDNAIIRVPKLETTGIRKFYNGPESFTPDNHFIMGQTPEVPNMYVLAGFNSTGIASAGGAGLAMAEWIIEGEPTRDLWPVDIRRFAKFHSNEMWLRERTKETLGRHYAIPWPNHEAETGRPLRRSPVHHLLEARGAVMGSRMGWERPNWYAPEGVAKEVEYSFGHQNWRPYVNAEAQAARSKVALLDQTAFAKFLIRGEEAEEALQYLCTADMAVQPGTTVYTGILNDRGGYESDVTVTRTAPNEYLLVTGSAQATRDHHLLSTGLAGRRVEIVDVTSAYAVLGVMGPNSRDLLGRLTKTDLTNANFPFYTSQEIELGPVPCRATRVSYIGELGWELYIPTEYAVTAYEYLTDAGEELGLTLVGHYAVEGMRLEKGYRAWGRELTPDRTPVEAGMTFTCKLGTDIAFRGREVVEKQRQNGVVNRIVSVTVDNPDVALWGGELLLRNGEPVGFVSSGAFGPTLGKGVGLACIERDHVVDKDYITGGSYQLDVAGELVEAQVSLRAPFDPTGARMKA